MKITTFSVPEIELKTRSGKTAKFPLTAFSTSFAIGTVPTCTASISPGFIQLSDTNTTKKQEIWTDEEFSDSAATLRIKMTVDGEAEKTIELFYGSVSYVSRASSMNGQGGSGVQIGLTIAHPVNRISLLTTQGYVYTTGADISTESNIRNIILQRLFSQQSYLGPDVDKTIGDQGGKVKNANYNIVDGIREILKLVGTNMKYSSDRDPLGLTVDKMADMLKGTIKFNFSNDDARRAFIKQFLKAIAERIAQSDILTAVVGTLHSSDYLMSFVPNNTRSVLIKPDDVWVKNAVSHVFKTSDIQTSKSLTRVDFDSVGPDLVYVSGKSREMFDQGADAAADISAYLGSYPPLDKARISYKVATIPAPTWTYELLSLQAPQEGTKTSNITTADGLQVRRMATPTTTGGAKRLKGMLDDYAKAMFAAMYGKQNTLQLVLDPSCIDSLQYLGQLCEAQTQLRNGSGEVERESMFGVLQSFVVSYASNGESSNLSVSANLAGARTKSMNERFAVDAHPIYVYSNTGK